MIHLNEFNLLASLNSYFLSANRRFRNELKVGLFYTYKSYLNQYKEIRKQTEILSLLHKVCGPILPSTDHIQFAPLKYSKLLSQINKEKKTNGVSAPYREGSSTIKKHHNLKEIEI